MPDLARVIANLKRLHDLPAAAYESAAQLALAYLRAGCDMFGFEAAAIRGSEPVVYDPGGILERRPAPLYSRCLNGHGAVEFAGPQPCAEDVEALDLLLRDLARELHRQTAMERLAFEARHDNLTGLPNRAHFMDLFETALRRGEGLALLFVDLDRFKQVNDTLGHAMGDRILRQIAGRLGSLVRRPGDLVARMAGDEFMALLTEIRDEQGAAAAGARILDALREPYRIDEYELFVTPSIGLSLYPRDGRDASSLLHRADLAMYRAKAEGGSKLRCLTPVCTGAPWSSSSSKTICAEPWNGASWSSPISRSSQSEANWKGWKRCSPGIIRSWGASDRCSLFRSRKKAG